MLANFIVRLTSAYCSAATLWMVAAEHEQN